MTRGHFNSPGTRRGIRPPLFVPLAFFVWLLAIAAAGAAIRFDVFLGCDGILCEGCWSPVTIEVQNDGPAFTGTIVVSSESVRGDTTRAITVELPTGTIKRFAIPVFTAARYLTSMDVQLLDERGRVRAEQNNVRPRTVAAAATPVLGALSRTAAGTPTLPKGPQGRPELSPPTARLQDTLFPDNPILLESLDAIYLNTDIAPNLKPPQVTALMDWLHAGGHLIIGIEQPGDIAALPWLRSVMPFDAKGLRTITLAGQFRDWVNVTQGRKETAAVPTAGSSTNRRRGGPKTDVPLLPADDAFDNKEMLIVTGQATGKVLVSAGETPLVVQDHIGLGRVTALCFSPEREPFKGWRNAPEFWAALLGIEPHGPGQPDYTYYNTPATDGVWGSFVETKQVHKLPVGVLMLILLGYLAVIGPLDQYWLKRINRQMLTWITFPLYVLAFSLLIYFIGYKLRAGDSEWNEINIVDVLPSGQRAELRGRTYGSLYSPLNQRYDLASNLRFATIRTEFMGWSGGAGSTEPLSVEQAGDAFRARAMVPVWTSKLFVSDWWQPAETPLRATLQKSGIAWTLSVENRLNSSLRGVRLAFADRLIELGEVPAGKTTSFTVQPNTGRSLMDAVNQKSRTFQSLINQRQQAFGSENARLGDSVDAATCASLIAPTSEEAPGNPRFIDAGKIDLMPVVQRGDAVLFAWVDNYSPVAPMNQFRPMRSRHDTFFRLAVHANP